MLARLRAHGLPVLPGVVVPVVECGAVFRRAAAALEEGGSGAARLEALDVGIERELLAELAESVRRLGEPVVVRSSSPLESDGVWAGAFSTFRDVTAYEVGGAVRGCWTSAFSVDALARAAAAGVQPSELRLAVLLQPQLSCDAGGVAQVLPEDEIEIAGVRGPPDALLGGWEPSVRARVRPGGAVEGSAAAAAFGNEGLRAVADLARQARDVAGLDRIEWGRAGGRVTLLQGLRTSAGTAPPAPPAHPVLGSAIALRVAKVVHRWSGPVAEQHVLPWALSLPDLSVGDRRASARPLDDWRRACARTGELTRQVWSSTAEAREVLANLRGPEPAAALARVEALTPPDPSAAAEALGLFAAVGAALAGRGVLPAGEVVWRCAPEDVEGALRKDGHTTLHRARSSRWEPFVHAVVTAQGAALRGIPAAPGSGAGRLRVIRNPHTVPPVGARPVLLASRPLPGLAPLLWDAAGLVIGSSNPAAHLLEVANSLGVPSVTGVDLERLTGATGPADPVRAVVVAVDGIAGTVAAVDLT